MPPHAVAPAGHAFMHIVVSWKVPVLSHVWSVLWSALHCVAPGEHMPPQDALPMASTTHAFGHVCVWMVPLLEQVWRVL